ncbi:hypothetical protein K492DRAFT_183047 [Lichtheimia hyalospora FSU 10163]|nr:hypothetical protein K492DRAFT_183047 [Lichtheimia hyalospora FSU 10163]
MSPQNSSAVIDELKALGVTVFEDHWIRRSPNAVLFGIVEHYGQIAQSKQGSRDYYQSIKLVDPSAPGTNECITTLLFHKSHAALYKELRYGDVFIVRDARVVSCRQRSDDGPVEMLLTDYTPNPIPMKGEERVGSINPKLLIQCTLWDKDAKECPDFEYGDYVRLRNARSKKGYYQEIVVRPGFSADNQGRKVFKLENENDQAVMEIKRPDDEYIHALRENIDHILSTNPMKPEISFDFGIKSYITVENERRFRLYNTTFQFD